ncbi:hypothetical protein PR202_ga10687 [Eleusine coracana subsp. coracana]|uniref:F-box domain-containing protein n=1 Tax=Eleusine coracana subsp. coracana TaxID=191504 RepID=A0AAV5C7A0_ELECO|nr:hypothetical protein PR202_ga10687 [Eleusine coracana subsp. coracana]
MICFLLPPACCTADELAVSQARQKGPRCRLGEGAKRSPLTLDRLPQDVLHQILALLPMEDAARTACVSRELSQSWRYYPELEFSAKTLALGEEHTSIQGQMATDIIKRIDDVLRNRAGVWVKRLKFELLFFQKVPFHCVNHWLDAATPRIEELTLKVPQDDKTKYTFPCELFSDENGFSIQSLCLSICAFHPVQGSCSFGSLKRVNFSWVRITTKESMLFLSNSLALEHLELSYCHEIACLRIPCTLQLFNYLWVRRCSMLQAIESDAPNLSSFHYEGPLIRFSFGHALQLKDINISIYPWFDLFLYARLELLRVAPNLETLFLMSADEIDGLYGTILIPPDEKFLHLKYLELTIVGPRTERYHFKFSSLVTFLDASPMLETFILHVEESAVAKTHLSIDPSKITVFRRHCHQNIKHVKITGFCPIQELVELIFCILENAVLLQCLTLDYRIHDFGKVLVARIAQDTGTRDYQEWWNNYGGMGALKEHHVSLVQQRI